MRLVGSYLKWVYNLYFTFMWRNSSCTLIKAYTQLDSIVNSTLCITPLSPSCSPGAAWTDSRHHSVSAWRTTAHRTCSFTTTSAAVDVTRSASATFSPRPETPSSRAAASHFRPSAATGAASRTTGSKPLWRHRCKRCGLTVTEVTEPHWIYGEGEIIFYVEL